MRPSPSAPSPTCRSPTRPTSRSRNRDARARADRSPTHREAEPTGARRTGARRTRGRGARSVRGAGARRRWRRRSSRSSSRPAPGRCSRRRSRRSPPRTTRRCRCSCSTTRPRSIRPPGSRPRCRPRTCGGSRRRSGSRPPRTRRCSTVEGATFLLFCHDDVALDPDARARDGRGGVPVERGDRRAEARRLRPPRGPDRGRDVGRPLRRAVLGDRAGRDRPGAARRRPRRVLRLARDDARSRRPVPRVRRVRRRHRRRAPTTSTCAGARGSRARACSSRRRAGCATSTAPATRSAARAGSRRGRRAPRRAPGCACCSSRTRTSRCCGCSRAASCSRSGEALGLALTRRWRHAVAVIAGWIPGRGGVAELRQARAATQTDAAGRRRRRPRPDGAGQRAIPQPARCSDCTPATDWPTRPAGPGRGWLRTREQLRRAPAIAGAARRPVAPRARIARADLPAGPRHRWLPGVAGRRVAVVDVHVAVALHDGREPQTRRRRCSR